LKSSEHVSKLIILEKEDIAKMAGDSHQCPYCEKQHASTNAVEQHVMKCGDYFDG
jgi:ribosomal protein L37AE/L43A